MNEHRRLANEIADIKANEKNIPKEEKRKISELQRRQILIMKQLENLFR